MKSIIRIVLVAVLILLVPLLAMQFTDEVNWELTDFVVVGVLLLGAGLIYELVARNVASATHRVALGVGLAAALFLIWVELAVGIFGTPFSGN